MALAAYEAVSLYGCRVVSCLLPADAHVGCPYDLAAQLLTHLV